MAYPLLNNTVGSTGLLTYANTVTDGYFGFGILLAIYFSFLIYQILNGTALHRAIVGAGWVSAVPASLFFVIGIISNLQMFVATSAFVLGIAFSYFANS